MSEIELQQARTVPLVTLRRFLTLSGWRQIADIQRGMDVYKFEADGAEVEIVLPQQTTGGEALRRITDALRTLSQINDQDVATVAANIRAVAIDVLRTTVADALVRNEAIQLDVAEAFLKNIKKLLSATATTELSPKPFFARVNKKAKEFADECRFGHTFRGSFGFTIETPVLPAKEIVEQTPPFERRVMQRVARGLKTVKIAVTEQNPKPITSHFRTGLSANMCETLAELADAVKGERLSFEFAFSPEWSVPPDIVVGERYEISTNDVELIVDAAKDLRLQEPNIAIAVPAKSDNEALAISDQMKDISVFICHSIEDREWVENNIVKFFENQNIKTCLSLEEDETKPQWDREIINRMEACDWFSLVVSTHAADSRWVKEKLLWAMNHKPARILTIKKDNYRVTDLDPRLRWVKRVDFTKNVHVAKQDLLRHLTSKI